MSRKRSNTERLYAENRLLKTQLETQTGNTPPEINQLNTIYQLATWLADPLHGTRYDTTRQPSRDPITRTGHTTTEGAATYQARNNLKQLKRDITHLTRRWQDRLSETGGRPYGRDDRQPRCWARTGEHRRGLRLPFGSKVCPVCLKPLKEDT